MDVLLAATSWQALLIAGLLGASVGSFLNVVIVRLPKQLQLQWKYECAELAGEPVREKHSLILRSPAPTVLNVSMRWRGMTTFRF